jgi:isopentenyldiphosphate isomerase
MEFKKVYIHLSTYKKLEKEYSKEALGAGQQSPYSIVFSAHSGRLLVHNADRGLTWPGAWYKFYGGLYPAYRMVKGVRTLSCVCEVGTGKKMDDRIMFTDSVSEDAIDRSAFSDHVICEIVVVPNTVPEDVSAMNEVQL